MLEKRTKLVFPRLRSPKQSAESPEHILLSAEQLGEILLWSFYYSLGYITVAPKKHVKQLYSAMKKRKVSLDTDWEPLFPKRVPVEDVLPDRILRQMTVMDLYHLTVQKRERTGDKRAKGMWRPNMSQFVDFIIEGKTTPGPTVFAEMITDLRSAYEHLKERGAHTEQEKDILGNAEKLLRLREEGALADDK